MCVLSPSVMLPWSGSPLWSNFSDCATSRKDRSMAAQGRAAPTERQPQISGRKETVSRSEAASHRLLARRSDRENARAPARALACCARCAGERGGDDRPTTDGQGNGAKRGERSRPPVERAQGGRRTRLPPQECGLEECALVSDRRFQIRLAQLVARGGVETWSGGPRLCSASGILYSRLCFLPSQARRAPQTKHRAP